MNENISKLFFCQTISNKNCDLFIKFNVYTYHLIINEIKDYYNVIWVMFLSFVN